MWFPITVPPRLATNNIPLAKEVDPDIITPSSGTVDVNLLPPPDSSVPFIPPKRPHNYIGGDLFPADEGSGVGLIHNGFGELISGTTGEGTDKDGYPGGRDGGHDVPFEVTLPSDWARGDAPPEGYIPKPLPTVRKTTTVATTTTTVATTTTMGTTTSEPLPPSNDLFEDYSSVSDFSSIFPKGTTSPLPSTEAARTTTLAATTTAATTTVPKTTPIRTTTVRTTPVEDVLNNELNPDFDIEIEDTSNTEINENLPIPQPRAETRDEAPKSGGLGDPKDLEKNEDLDNVLLNDAGVLDSDDAQPAVAGAVGTSENTDSSWWSAWSTCSKSCDTGIRYRFTQCTKESTLPDCIARNGRGMASETKTCHVKDCEAPRVRWSDWSECSRSCGEGLQTRMALCVGKPIIPECIGRRTAIQRRPCAGDGCKGVCSPDCINGGKCESDGTCKCPSGYSGPQCQNKRFTGSRCNPRCLNGGSCTASIPPRCACPQGYKGIACETAVCQKGCRNGGRCVAPDTCQCPRGYEGPDCTKPVCRHGCQNGGTCVRPNLCRCQLGYRGTRCQSYYCRQRCRNGGRCIGPDKCECPSGFSGAVCQSSACYGGCPEGNTCVAPGRCVNTGTGEGGAGNSYNMASYSKNCRLTSYIGTFKQSYVRPEIQTTYSRCGPYLRDVCPRTSVVYSRAYRTYYRTSYRVNCREPT